MKIHVGDIIVFKGEGFVFTILSAALSLFDKSWRLRKWKGWHTAYVSEIRNGVPYICEALAGGVQENPLDMKRDFTIYYWLDNPDLVKIERFTWKHLGDKYDILVYPLTAIAYLLRHYWGRPVPRLFDSAYSCWELVYYLCDRMGKPLAESYDFPLISEMMNLLERKSP